MTDKDKHSGNERSENAKRHEIQYVSLDIQGFNEENKEIDIFEVLDAVWVERKKLISSIGVSIVLGLLIAFLSPKEFTSEVRLLPENQAGISLGGLGSIAQQFGISAAPQVTNEAISANLFPAIMQSNVFLVELMDYEVVVPNTTQEIKFEQYFQEYQSGSIMKYTIRLPITIKNWLLRDDEVFLLDNAFSDRGKLDRLVRMSNKDWETLRKIRERISASLDTETGIVSVSVKLQNPIISADIADEVVQMLSEYITEKRTEKARRELQFIEERFTEAKTRFEQAQQELATFNDENRGQLTAMARTEEQMLQSRYNLNFNLYNSMAERLEEARIKLQEETPVINILEPAAVPDESSEPNRILILGGFIFLGLIIGLGRIFGPKLWGRIKSGNKSR